MLLCSKTSEIPNGSLKNTEETKMNLLPVLQTRLPLLHCLWHGEDSHCQVSPCPMPLFKWQCLLRICNLIYKRGAVGGGVSGIPCSQLLAQSITMWRLRLSPSAALRYLSGTLPMGWGPGYHVWNGLSSSCCPQTPRGEAPPEKAVMGNRGENPQQTSTETRYYQTSALEMQLNLNRVVWHRHSSEVNTQFLLSPRFP